MNAVKATIIYLSGMATVMIAWFYVIRHFKNIIQYMATEVSISEVNTVAQNQINAFNIVFVVLIIALSGWYLYVLHSRERETTFLDLRPKGGLFR